MNALPRLLRLLDTAAAARDKHGLRDVFKQLDPHHGWTATVEDFIKRMPPRHRQYVHAFRLSEKRCGS